MNTESSRSRPLEDSRLERAIVLQLLREDHDPGWAREELLAEIGAEAQAFEDALRRLDAEGVVHAAETQLRASRAARRIDELGLIGV
jgi:hypothetical protein